MSVAFEEDSTFENGTFDAKEHENQKRMVSVHKIDFEDGIKCEIIFDSISYIPSQSINLKVELSLEEQKSITSIGIEIEGIVETSFKLFAAMLKCRSFRLIFYTKSILVGSEHAIDIPIAAGVQVFNYQVKFPTYLPYTYKDDFCEIKYKKLPLGCVPR